MSDEEKPIENTLSLKDIQAEKNSLLKQREQAVATVNALNGAIQAMDYLIKKLTEQAPE